MPNQSESSFDINKKDGWISLYRSVCNSDLWLSEPFTKAQAWVDMLLLAQHKPKVINIRGNLITVPRGAFAWSERSLQERWKWSRSKIKNFKKYLEKSHQISLQTSNLITITYISNYEVYQTTDQSTERPQKDHRKTTDQTTDQTTYNNVNNVNNGTMKQKEHYVEFSKKQNSTLRIPFKEIVEYLNNKNGSRFSSSSKATQSHIRARWQEGFRLEDFKTVIDKKWQEWHNKPEMVQYLRPQTLFGPKFESYINQKVYESTEEKRKRELEEWLKEE